MILINFNLHSQPEKAKKELANSIQSSNTNSNGKLYYIAIPPNEVANYPTQSLDIFVSSSFDTKVTLSNPATGIYIVKKVAKNKVTSFSSSTGDIDWSRDEIRQSQTPIQQGLRLESDEPISVYVMNSKVFTTDGYLAIPVSFWGTRYIHLSFWDFYEFAPGWAGGFIVVASEDNTKVTIQLKGRGAGFATTDRGSKIGKSLIFTLNKGEVYMVRGDGKTRGVFDLSGSEINSNKRIGMISFHERCMIPVTVVTNGRDHLSEMLPPVSAWGQNYYSVELDRKSDLGDYFRVISSEDNTKVVVKWFDKNTKQMLGNETIIFKKAGDFEEFNDNQATFPHAFPSVRGTSAFEADKPILVMQYAYSSNWDGGSSWWDPFMTLVVPKEQYTTNAIFQTPSNKGGNEYNNNFFNIIAIGDTVDLTNNQKLLSSIMLDGKRLIDSIPNFINQKIPNTNLFWAAVKVEKGSHTILGDTLFGGYVYGYSNADSYGWPAATAFRRNGQNDTLAPVVKPKGECGVYTVNITELRDGKESDDPRQIDTGVEFIPTLSSDTSKTYNFGEVKVYDFITFLPAEHNFDIKIEVKDKYADGLATITVTDAVGNDTTFSIRYEADSITITPNPVDFKFQRVGTTSPEMLVTLNSKSDSLITIKSIKLKDGKDFNISDGNQLDPNGVILLQPRSTKIVKLTYTPIKEYVELNPKYDLDSLMIETKCLIHNFPVIGKGVLPRIFVEDWDAGNLAADEKRCKKSYSGSGLLIRNDGTDTLVVSAIDQTDAQLLPFTMSSQATINLKFPFKLAQGAKANLEDICIMSPVKGQFLKNVKFITNNAIGKDTSVWKANVDKNSNVEVSSSEYFSIDAIIPNPITNDGGIIQYSIGKEAKIDISIVTALGSKFVLIENQTVQTGKYSLDIPINKLSNGSYFVELKADGVVISKKFVIIK